MRASSDAFFLALARAALSFDSLLFDIWFELNRMFVGCNSTGDDSLSSFSESITINGDGIPCSSCDINCDGGSINMGEFERTSCGE